MTTPESTKRRAAPARLLPVNGGGPRRGARVANPGEMPHLPPVGDARDLVPARLIPIGRARGTDRGRFGTFDRAPCANPAIAAQFSTPRASPTRARCRISPQLVTPATS